MIRPGFPSARELRSATPGTFSCRFTSHTPHRCGQGPMLPRHPLSMPTFSRPRHGRRIETCRPPPDLGPEFLPYHRQLGLQALRRVQLPSVRDPVGHPVPDMVLPFLLDLRRRAPSDEPGGNRAGPTCSRKGRRPFGNPTAADFHPFAITRYVSPAGRVQAANGAAPRSEAMRDLPRIMAGGMGLLNTVPTAPVPA
jgi:hypothetical protein